MGTCVSVARDSIFVAPRAFLPLLAPRKVFQYSGKARGRKAKGKKIVGGVELGILVGFEKSDVFSEARLSNPGDPASAQPTFIIDSNFYFYSFNPLPPFGK